MVLVFPQHEIGYTPLGVDLCTKKRQRFMHEYPQLCSRKYPIPKHIWLMMIRRVSCDIKTVKWRDLRRHCRAKTMKTPFNVEGVTVMPTRPLKVVSERGNPVLRPM